MFFSSFNFLSSKIFEYSNVKYVQISFRKFTNIRIYSFTEILIFVFEYPLFGNKYSNIRIYSNIRPTLVRLDYYLAHQQRVIVWQSPAWELELGFTPSMSWETCTKIWISRMIALFYQLNKTRWSVLLILGSFSDLCTFPWIVNFDI